MTSFRRYAGYGAVILSAFFFALISQLTKLAYRSGMTPLQLVTLQFTTATVILLAFAVLFRPAVLKLPAGMLPKLIVHGLVGSIGTNILYAIALVYLPASLGTMLLFSYPILVTVGALIFFRARIRLLQVIALALSVAGTMLSTQFWQIPPGSLAFTGIVLGLGSAVAYAFFNLYGEHILAKINPLTSLTYVQLVSALTLLLYQFPGYISGRAALVYSGEQFAIGLAMATLATIIPFWLLLVGIKQIGAAKLRLLVQWNCLQCS